MIHQILYVPLGDHRVRDCMVVGFTTKILNWLIVV